MTVLLGGKPLTRARSALADLSARLLQLRPSELPDLSLADGLCGVALAHAALHHAFPRAGHGARAERMLLRAMERLGTGHVDPGLYLGVAGLGWVATQLLERSAHAELLAPLDRALADVVAEPTWSERFDLVYGIAGIAVYALERLPDPSARALLAAIVQRLAATARRQDRGVAWWSNPAWVARDPSQTRPAHHDWSLGVAHGTAGVIALLGRVVAADVDAATRETARSLLASAVEWLLAQELPEDQDGRFSVYIAAEGVARQPARIAWCVGELGIAAALLVAAQGAKRPAWRRAAIRIGLAAAARDDAATGVVDAGLCHGAAGVAHVFHRLYRATEDDRFARASRRWFDKALAHRTPGTGFAGFRALDPNRKHRLAWQRTPGFLTGGAGVALALVAATRDVEPTWDRALLLS